MYKLLAITLLIATLSCNTNLNKPTIALANSTEVTAPLARMTTVSTELVATKEPYEIKMKMNTLENDTFAFEIDMILHNGAHFVSPNATGNFTGKFTLHLDDNDYLTPVSELIETPRSVEEFDPHPFVNGNVNWVREDTNYTLKLKSATKEYFSVKGFIQFTIEPRCTLEKIPIIIKNVKGELRVELFLC